MGLRVVSPMLAGTRPPTEPAEWVFEPKLDGWPCLVHVDETVTFAVRPLAHVLAVEDDAPISAGCSVERLGEGQDRGMEVGARTYATPSVARTRYASCVEAEIETLEERT